MLLYYTPILWATALLIYINNLGHISKHLTLIVFLDNTSLFFSHIDRKISFENSNNELKRISQ